MEEKRNSFNFVYDLQAIDSRIRKKKRIAIDEKLPICLNIKIDCAQGIDELNHYPWFFRRQYCVLFWVKPSEQYYTRFVTGILDPHWNEKEEVLLENSCDDHGFLNVEVVRIGCPNDPGTSTGVKVVGRARIPLPKEFNCENQGSFGLVKMEDGELKSEGFIVLSMELQKRENPISPFGRY